MEPTKEYGWRMLNDGETINDGDEVCIGGEWITSGNAGLRHDAGRIARRRKIDPGEGWEIVPCNKSQTLDMEYFHPIDMAWKQNTSTPDDSDGSCGRYPDIAPAFRRRIQPVTEWREILRQPAPALGQQIWINHESLGTMLTFYKGESKKWTHWRPVKPGEIPEPPKVEPEKSQAVLDEEAADEWFEKHGIEAVSSARLAMRVAYTAGLRDGRAAK